MPRASYKIFTITPVKKLDHIKSRLSSLLSLEERKLFSLSMLQKVLSASKKSTLIQDFIVVSPDTGVLAFAEALGAYVLREESERGVNEAIYKATDVCMKMDIDVTIVVPADLPLITSDDIDRLAKLACEGERVIVTPSIRFDGTNALVRRPPDIIKTYYDEDSFFRHLSEAIQNRLRADIYLSRRLMLDIDSPRDFKQLASIVKSTGDTNLLDDFLLSKLRE